MHLSVIVPVYGTRKYLPRCLDSLMTQTLRDCEFILVDDASPDGSARILADYAKRDSRFRILTHEENRGLFAARLTGIKAARGAYIAFLDSDDYVSVDFYRAALAKAAEGFDIVMGDTVWEQADGRRIVRPLHALAVPARLHGDAVREAFYGQELACYSWHTVWNKVYRRELMMQCVPYYERLTDHTIMCEDIAYSAVLLHKARSMAHIPVESVFYCEHPASSTGDAWKDRQRFFKHYTDIVHVFDFVEDYLREMGDTQSLAHLDAARIWYARMWRKPRLHMAAKGADADLANTLTQRLAPGYHDENAGDDREIWYCDSVTAPWLPGMEKLRRAIAGADEAPPQIVSFDVFDTLIARPFREPSDLFSMLEDTWQQANRRCLLSFAKARSEAEASARAWAAGHKEEIDMFDIYNALQVTAGVSEDCADTMRAAECEAEIRFCEPRCPGIELLKMALALGRRVVLISDMYLPGSVIRRMLKKCGVPEAPLYLSNERNALKWNGGLYRVALADLAVPPQQVLHIGDNWRNDVVVPADLGMRAMHHPRAMDVMTDPHRTQLAALGQQTAAAFGGSDVLAASLTFRCMQGLAANRFFANGFRSTGADSFFAAHPERLGYYAMGGHVLALAQWLIARAKADGRRKLVFLARDGYLVKQAVDLLLADVPDAPETCYVPASRRLLLPALTAHPTDFYDLPINIPAYTVEKTVRLLDFCTVDIPLAEMRKRAEDAGFSWQEPYPGRYRYTAFIAWYLENLYDGAKHQRAYDLLRDFYAPVLTPGCVCVDMGYSGRLQAALSQLAGWGVPACFVHDDGKEAPRLSRAYGDEIACFYAMKPAMSGAFREFLLSSDEPPCTGLARRDGQIVPQYGPSEYNRAAQMLVRIVQREALAFVGDYHRTFRGTMAERVDGLHFSMPFESALRCMTAADLSMLRGVRFEDTVFAGRDDLDLCDLITAQAAQANGGEPALHEASRFKKAVWYALFDHHALKEAVKRRLAGSPKAYEAARRVWLFVKKLRGR